MYLKQEQLPWKPSIILSGKTFYTIDLKKKQVVKHVDEWDIPSHNQFFSVRVGARIALRRSHQEASLLRIQTR